MKAGASADALAFGDDSVIRSESLGPDGLHARGFDLGLASVSAVIRRKAHPVLRRFEENAQALEVARRAIAGRGDGPASLEISWLLDNFHIVEDVLREVRQDLPRGYDAELPKLPGGPLRYHPRVYALALGPIAHCDSDLDESGIDRFVEGFQASCPLQTGELWAIPTMLRLGLLENLRRLAETLLKTLEERRRAETWAAPLVAQADASDPARAAETSTEPPSLPAHPSDAFVERLVQLLRDQGSPGTAVLEKLESILVSKGDGIDEALGREHRRQAASQVTIANCVTSLRLLAALDWREFFERHSAVDAILREDPAGAYARQDFATRDRYRRVVERIARGARADEREVAMRAIALARGGPEASPQGHVGFYLIDRGRRELERCVACRGRWTDRLEDLVLSHPRALYFGGLATLGLILLVGILATGLLSAGSEDVGWWRWGLLVLVLLLPVSELAVGLLHQVLNLVLPPRVLPKLEFKDGIPADCATFVVMPSMLTRPQSAEALLEKVEAHYLSNPDPQLRFALLTDFADAPEEELTTDEGCLRPALEGVARLNRRYCEEGPDRFFVFHRRRVWSETEGCWMGWERKRGKLLEFNRLLRGHTDTTYVVCSAAPADLPTIRFVITLDTDTQMPRDTAGRLVGTLAHPLNRPQFDASRRRVVAGYGVLQPRVSYNLLAATRSRFAGLLAASTGIDPYATAVSDAYMDLFGSGTFTGKGIYDVDAFEAAAGRAFPESLILSHDLIEGNFARCGLATDIELFDDFPSRYHAYARREHRWARGDWQIKGWLRRRVPTAEGVQDNTLPTLERWKVLDNLRRGLVAPALVLLLVLGWSVLPGSAWLWTAVAAAVVAVPLWQQVTGAVVGTIRSRSLATFRRLLEGLPATAGMVLLAFVLLADKARLMLDATLRSLVRLHITRRRLLEWETSDSAERRLGAGLDTFVRTMWPASVLATGLAALVGLVRPAALPAALPVLLAWFVSPLVAYLMSRPRRIREARLTDDERREMRGLARRTWSYFETFVGPEDHWLPPDNYQQDPDHRVAHRTSPTNGGLLLVSTLAAHDLGYLGSRSLVERIGATLDSLEQLKRYQGHLYNWYDTRTLEPLEPLYVSTVDSGNLLGCLIVLKQGLKELEQAPVVGPSALAGLADTLGLAAEEMAAHPGFSVLAREHGILLRSIPDNLLEWDERLLALERDVSTLPMSACDRGEAPREEWQADRFVHRYVALIRERRTELNALAPWLGPLRGAIEEVARCPLPPDLVARWRELQGMLVETVSLGEMVQRSRDVLVTLEELRGAVRTCSNAAPLVPHVEALDLAVRESEAIDVLSRARELAARAEELARGMDFRFLYRTDRDLFSIGYNPTLGRLDSSCYDLLASEACLTSYLAVARGDAPRRHWFQLGRAYIRSAGRLGLLSWGGTMFEYLMPRLFLRSLPGTLLAEACRTAVAGQVDYGRRRNVPWGISESAYADRHAGGDFQYRAFGVPGLGLKQGLSRDLVVAPYATVMATIVAPREAVRNLRRLAGEGGTCPFGYYEAIDYTNRRLPEGSRSIVVQSVMAHHQGMSLVALTNALLEEPMPRRFHAEPMVRAAELLLQERLPRDVRVVHPGGADSNEDAEATSAAPPLGRRLASPATPTPRTHLLANDRYSVMLTNAGSGYSAGLGLDVTRWHEDRTRDAWGQFLYLRDAESGRVWSAGHQPTCRPAERYEVLFHPDKASIRRLDASIETVLDVVVSPEHPVEVRRVTLTNHDRLPRIVELTSYAEVVLLPRGEGRRSCADGPLPCETEWVAASGALLCRRPMRPGDGSSAWAIHVSTADPVTLDSIEYESDRTRFLGRGRTPGDPAALDPGARLSGTVGEVLEPILSLRRSVRLEPGETSTLTFTTGVATTREEALALADRFQHRAAGARAFELAWARHQVQHQHDPSVASEACLYQRLAGHLLYVGSTHRSGLIALTAGPMNPGELARFGLSAHRPILTVTINGWDEIGLVRQLLTALNYLRARGLEFDLVLIDDRSELAGPFRQPDAEVIAGAEGSSLALPAGVTLIEGRKLTLEARMLLLTCSRVSFDGGRGDLAAQLDRVELPPPLPEALAPTRRCLDGHGTYFAGGRFASSSDGPGGFTPDGREYQLTVRSSWEGLAAVNGKRSKRPRPLLPPTPSCNVVANPGLGFLATEAGLGCTWGADRHTDRLTPWCRDFEGDSPGEVLYLRDEESGESWTPTPLPVLRPEPTLVRHGQGYTVFERDLQGLAHELSLFIPVDDPVKLVRLRITNQGEYPRRLSATFYAEWVLGTERDRAPMGVITELDPETGALLAHNLLDSDPAQVAFADTNLRPRTVTGDRTEFLGRNGSAAAPEALRRVGLSGRVGAGLDPCAGIQGRFTLEPGEERIILFVLGRARSRDEARELVRRYGEPRRVEAALGEVRYRSDRLLGQPAPGGLVQWTDDDSAHVKITMRDHPPSPSTVGGPQQ